MIFPTRPASNVIPCTLKHLIYLCERMREDERAQYLALTGAREFAPEVAAVGFFNTPGLKFTVLGKDNYPAAAGGAEEVSKGVWQIWMVGGTEGWSGAWHSITRTGAWMVASLLKQEGVRRVQATCFAARAKSATWFQRCMGMTYEGTWKRYAGNGEDVSFFAIVAEG